MPSWYFEKSELKNTPSLRDGIDSETEARYRREGARFIMECGINMGLRYDTMATGVVFYHRFYMFHSFHEFPRYVMATCCLFLAGKVEETPKKCKDLVKAGKQWLEAKNLKKHSDSFGDDPCKDIMIYERILLQTIKFDLQVDHPYGYLLKYAKTLKGNQEQIRSMVQMAWTFINDSYSTTLCLQWEPEIIAISLMYLTSKLSKLEITDWIDKKENGSANKQNWWDQFVESLRIDILEDVCHQILDLYATQQQEQMNKSQPNSNNTPNTTPTNNNVQKPNMNIKPNNSNSVPIASQPNKRKTPPPSPSHLSHSNSSGQVMNDVTSPNSAKLLRTNNINSHSNEIYPVYPNQNSSSNSSMPSNPYFTPHSANIYPPPPPPPPPPSSMDPYSQKSLQYNHLNNSMQQPQPMPPMPPHMYPPNNHHPHLGHQPPLYPPQGPPNPYNYYQPLAPPTTTQPPPPPPPPPHSSHLAQPPPPPPAPPSAQLHFNQYSNMYHSAYDMSHYNNSSSNNNNNNNTNGNPYSMYHHQANSSFMSNGSTINQYNSNGITKDNDQMRGKSHHNHQQPPQSHYSSSNTLASNSNQMRSSALKTVNITDRPV